MLHIRVYIYIRSRRILVINSTTLPLAQRVAGVYYSCAELQLPEPWLYGRPMVSVGMASFWRCLVYLKEQSRGRPLLAAGDPCLVVPGGKTTACQELG